MIDSVLAGFVAMSGWEYVAALFSLLYVLLAIKQNSLCWPAAFISTTIYTILFWQGALLMESFLNFYYMVMAVYGFQQWNKRNGGLESTIHVTPVIKWRTSLHGIWIATLSVLIVVVGFLFETYTDARLTYLDTFTTIFALFATYLLTQKVLENWLYWVVIDVASIFLYAKEGYYATMVLFVLYVFFAAHGYLTWRKEYAALQQSKCDAVP